MINYSQPRKKYKQERHILGLLPCNTREDQLFNASVLLGCILLAGLMLICSCHPAHARDYTDEQYVNAIYKAEGGSSATYLFGIRSVRCEGYADCRQVCLNTVRNNRKRWAKNPKGLDFIQFLASRYCPIGADNDPKGLNKNWIKNVSYFLRKEKA